MSTLTTVHLDPGAVAAGGGGEPASNGELMAIYVWDVLVRTAHWLIALSVVVLATTGFLIGHPLIVAPGRAEDHYVMGTVRAIHFYAAIVFALAVLSRIVWMFIGPDVTRWHHFIPVTRERRQDFWTTMRFYLFALRKPPYAIGHNPVAGIAYSYVFALYLVMIGSGLGMYSLSAGVGSPLRAFSFLVPLFGGTALVRWIHHACMWLLIAFVVHHVYSAFLVSIVEKNGTVDSMVSGWKWFSKSIAEAELQKRAMRSRRITGRARA